MDEKLNEKLGYACETIEEVYLKLTYLNLQYHRIVRDLETTKGEMKRTIRELRECNVLAAESHEELTKPLMEATLKLNAGMNTAKHVLAQLRRYSNTVNMLMDANDDVEECLQMLDGIGMHRDD